MIIRVVGVSWAGGASVGGTWDLRTSVYILHSPPGAIIPHGQSAAPLIPVFWSASVILVCRQEVPQELWRFSTDSLISGYCYSGAGFRYLRAD